MNTLILCDRRSIGYYNTNLQTMIKEAVEKAGSTVELITVNGDEIAPCLGCFKCWIQTPGLCIQTADVANEIAAMEVRTDIMILLSEITYGGYSYDIKAYLDRSIPNILPFFSTLNDEMHHKLRYPPMKLRITIGYGNPTFSERTCFSALSTRNSLNMQPLNSRCYSVSDLTEFKSALKQLHEDISTEAIR